MEPPGKMAQAGRIDENRQNKSVKDFIYNVPFD